MMKVVKFFQKLISHGHEDPSPQGYFWVIIVLLLAIMSSSIVFFSRSANYDLSALALPSQSSKEPERPSRIYSVFYKNGTFSPTNIRIRAGDTVRFENDSLVGIGGIRIVSDPHPGHDNLNGFDSIGDIPAGGVFTYTFSIPGIFGYHNENNISETGKVIVRE